MVLAALLCPPAPARAAEFSVTSKTLGESYRIRGRDGLFAFTKTRLIESLSLYGGHLFKPLLKGKAVPLKLSLNVGLLLDHDFGVTAWETDPGSASGYVPLLRKTRFGFLRGYAHLTLGTFRRTDLRIGRQTALDVTGMYAFDGFKAGFTWVGIGAVDVAYGFETVPLFNLSVLDFSPEGISWEDREGLQEDVHPEITQPELRPMVAAAGKLLISRGGFFSIGYRRTYAALDMDTVSFERLSLGFAVTGEESPLSADIVASWDFLWERISELRARTSLRVAPRWDLRFGFLHFYPVFDATSIFNVFYIDPFNEVSIGLAFSPTRDASITLSALGRQTQRRADEAEAFSDAGGSLQLLLGAGPLRLAAGTRITDGESGTIAGLELNPQLHFLDDIVIVRLGGGLWFFSDPLRAGHHATSGGGTAALAWTITRGIQVTGSVNLYSNRISGVGAGTLWLLSITL